MFVLTTTNGVEQILDGMDQCYATTMSKRKLSEKTARKCVEYAVSC